MKHKKRSRKVDTKQDIFVSIVAVPRSGRHLEGYISKLTELLQPSYENYEVIIIDNRIDEAVVGRMVSLLEKIPCIRIVRLSRPVEYDVAVIAGLDSAIGDYCVITDPAIDPIDRIPDIVALNKKYDVVQGVADISNSRFVGSSLGRKGFYAYSRRYLNVDVSPQATYFISLNRRAVKAVTSSSQNTIYIRHAARVVGGLYATMRYRTLGNPLRITSLQKGLTEAAGIVSSYSTHPLRVMSIIGVVMGIVNVIYAAYVVGVQLFKGHVAEGWTTMSLQISGMFFVLFLLLAVTMEYLGKILAEARRDVRYLVADELTSTVSIANVNRKNVTQD